jgi:hypothetical protein
MLGPFPATTERAVAPGLGWLGTVPVTAFLPAGSFTDALTTGGAELLAGVVDADVLAGLAGGSRKTSRHRTGIDGLGRINLRTNGVALRNRRGLTVNDRPTPLCWSPWQDKFGFRGRMRLAALGVISLMNADAGVDRSTRGVERADPIDRR